MIKVKHLSFEDVQSMLEEAREQGYAEGYQAGQEVERKRCVTVITVDSQVADGLVPMNMPRFLLAKYTPDLRRMEPHNCGVIVWSPEDMVARFLGQHSDGKVRSPGFVQQDSRQGYREWVGYWNELIRRGTIKTNKGVVVPKSSPDFVDVLRSKSKLQFMLVDAGEIREHVPREELGALADELFEELVQADAAPAHVKEHRRHSIALHPKTLRCGKHGDIVHGGTMILGTITDRQRYDLNLYIAAELRRMQTQLAELARHAHDIAGERIGEQTNLEEMARKMGLDAAFYELRAKSIADDPNFQAVTPC